MRKITHNGEDIDWVNGPDKSGSTNTYLPPEECGDALNNRHIYKMVGGACVLRDDAGEIIAAQEAVDQARKDKISAIVAAQEADGSHTKTPDQIRTYIDTQIDGAPTAVDKLEAIKDILKKLAIYILRNK